MASGASYAATAAALPPPEPPGIRSRSHGFFVEPYAEYSVEEPIANSSMLVLPIITVPASRSRSTIVASYGGCQPSRIFEPAVVGTPLVAITSFTATGTPASGPVTSPRSTRSAAASAPARSTCRNACTWSSTAPIRSRCAVVTSTAETSRLLILPASSAADIRVRSVTASVLLVQDARDPETALEGVRRPGERLLLRQARLRLVVAVH